jgi:hypothetical protein
VSVVRTLNYHCQPQFKNFLQSLFWAGGPYHEVHCVFLGKAIGAKAPLCRKIIGRVRKQIGENLKVVSCLCQVFNLKLGCFLQAEPHYAEYHYSSSPYAECHCECHRAKCRSTEHRHADRHYAEYLSFECQVSCYA